MNGLPKPNVPSIPAVPTNNQPMPPGAPKKNRYSRVTRPNQAMMIPGSPAQGQPRQVNQTQGLAPRRLFAD